MANTNGNGGKVEVDDAELEALRTLARRALELSGMIDRRELVAAQPRRPRPDSERLTYLEGQLVQRLVQARGGAVPYDRLVKHIHTTDRHASTDEWNRNPATTVCWARRKLRTLFGQECISTIWHTRVNAKGHVVRDTARGIVGYAWTGPDIAGMALEAAEAIAAEGVN